MNCSLNMIVILVIATALLFTQAISTSSVPYLISEGRISGGNPVSDDRFAFMACLVGFRPIYGYMTGAGTIISSLYIISAAHFTSKYVKYFS